MATGAVKPTDFRSIWARALREFHGSTSIDLEDPTIFHPQDVDDLIGHLTREHHEFGQDARSSKFTNVLKSAIGPFNFLTATAGSTAAQASRLCSESVIVSGHAADLAQMFPGGSQVLAAFGLLINAGAAVTQSFDAVGALFAKLGNFASRLKEVSHESIPDALGPIYQAILVCLLRVCELAINMTFRTMKEEKSGHAKWLQKLKKKTRPIFANVDEYMKQLMGGNGEVNAAVGALETLVENESRMMQAIVLRKATSIQAIAVDIQGLTIRCSKAVYDLQADTSEMKYQVTLIGQSLERMETTQNDIQENTVELKITTTSISKAQRQQGTTLEAIDKKITEMMKSASNKQQDAGDKSKAAVSSESKLWKKLEANLGVKSVRTTNATTYERISSERIKGTAEWVLEDDAAKQWFQGETGFLVVSGDAGNGKTFLASRIIDHINDQLKPNTHGSDKSMAFFFCRKGQTEGQYVSLALKAMAYEIARTGNDKLYAKHLTDLVESGKLSQNDIALPAAARQDQAETSDAITSPVAEEQTITDAADTKPGAEENSAPGDDMASVEPSQDPMLTQKLRRVNTAVIERQPLESEDEESAVRPVQRHWEHLFGNYFTGSAKHVYLVFDGLDECNETEAVALCAAINATFAKAERKATVNIHMLLLMTTARAKTFSSELLSAASVLQIRSDLNSSDLDVFVHKRLETGWSNKLVRPSLRHEVRRSVLDGCDGNFLKASLVVDEIVSLSREDAIRSFLSNIPSTIESAMLLVINRLSRQLGTHNLEDLRDILAWVACARRDLRLTELDAILTVRQPLGARVVDLETRLRESFATLFTVTGHKAAESSVEDERVRRRLEAVTSGSNTANSQAMFDEKVDISTANKLQSSARTQDNDDAVALRKATAEMHKNFVTLSHTLIAEQIQKRTAQADGTSLTTDSMQATVLLRCLEILCDANGPHDERTSKLAGNYAGLYFTEHLLAIDPSEIEHDTRLQIMKLLLKLFRDPLCIARWVRFGQGWLADDLLNLNFCRRVVRWVQQEDLHAGLSAAESLWIREAGEAPWSTLFGDIAIAVARRWLTQVTSGSEDFLKFLWRYQGLIGSSQPAKLLQDEGSDELSSVSTEEILRIAEWAGFEKDGRWYARIGLPLRILDRGDDALDMYKKAVELDSNDGPIRAGLGATFAAQDKFEDAARETSASIDLHIASIDRGEPSPDPDFSLISRLMTTRQELATYYVNIEKVDLAVQQYEIIIKEFEGCDPTATDWDELLSIVVAYYHTLTNDKRWDGAAVLLRQLLSHPQRFSEEFVMLYKYIAYNEPTLLQLGYRRKEQDTLIALNDNALTSIARYGDEDEVPSLIYVRAMLLLRLDNSRADEAMRLLKAVSQDEEVDDWTKDRADRELARQYLNRTLRAREEDRWTDVGRYAESLVNVVVSEKDVDGKPAFGTRDCSLVLAAWDRNNGRMARAKKCAEQAILLAIDMLSDNDLENDVMAWLYMSDALLSIGDVQRAVAATNMLRQSRFEEPTTTDMVKEPGKVTGEATDNDAQLGASRDCTEATSTMLDHDDNSITAMEDKNDLDANAAGTDNATPQQATLKSDSALPEPSNTSEGLDVAASKDQEPAATNHGHPFYYCDGSCFENIANNALMWRCSFCIADFCDDCHNLIMGETMNDWQICGSAHEHVRIPGEPVKYPTGIIKVDGKDVQVADMIATLRKEWNYPKEPATTP